ncbi:hypothetical protein AURDEDRAFT_111612 [Auricularia subglabra TFB-10046 SS5]|nr:hypothetical protein AURDEDRAFT_111612 [Auricularia subglabra TFB-10046 SS5]
MNPNGSTSTVNAQATAGTGTGTGSLSHEHAVVTRASLLPVLNTSSSSVVPMAVAPATYRDASAALDLRSPVTGNSTPTAGEELYRGTFVMSEQSFAYNSPMPSTVAFSVPSVAMDHDELPLPALPPMPRSRPLSMQRPPSVATIRTAGAQFAASIRRFAWGRKRPGTATSATGQTSAHPDRDLALPDLVMRAEILGDMLAEGRLPHDSVTDLPLTGDKARLGHPTGGRSSSLGGMRSRYGKLPQDVPPGPRSAPLRRPKTPKRVTLAISSTFAGVASRVNPFSDPPEHRRNASIPESEKRYLVVPRRRCVRWIIVVFASALVVVSILLGVLLTIRRDGRADASLCTGNMTGALCNMDATCVCTSTDSCMPLAQAVVWTIPPMNRNFGLRINETDVALTMFDLTGVRIGNCAPQANLIDVAPGLDGIHFPNRTLFAQTALLWSLYASQDLSVVAKMRQFIAGANFTILDKDGPISGAGDKFSMQALGYTFDFAAMAAVALPASFEKDAKPDAQQLAAVSDADRKALDRIYLNAKASSTQHSVALSKYWTSELQLPESSLPQFIAAMQTSPVLLPFDATFSTSSADMVDLFTSDSLSVPPPAGCYPRANSTDLQSIATFEHQAFGIDATNASNTHWVSSCISARPVYGVLNPLRWRTPFLNTSSHPGQALSLNQPAKLRAAFHLGDMLSPFPFDHPRTDLTLDFTDPRDFGTVDYLHHVLLSYLQAMPTVKLAAEAAKFIIDVSAAPNSAPPPLSSPLYSTATQLPVIGAAFLGTLAPSDVAFFYSDFSSPDGSLFFGTDAGMRFRRWALDNVEAPIAWADGALAPQFVKDAAQDDTFDRAWDAADGSLETVLQMFNRALYFES